jgi:hypothetical protein
MNLPTRTAVREPLDQYVARHIWPHAFETGTINAEQKARLCELGQRAADAVREYDAEDEV